MKLLGNVKIPEVGVKILRQNQDLDSFIATHSVGDIYRSRARDYINILSGYGLKVVLYDVVGGRINGDCDQHTDPENHEGFPCSIVSFSCPSTDLIFVVSGEKMVINDGDIVYFDSALPHEVRVAGGTGKWEYVTMYCNRLKGD